MDDEKFDVEAKRCYAGGIVHAALMNAASHGHLLHVEAHHEGTTPTGDMVVRVAAFGGSYRLHLTPIDEERF